jgi:PmbA protein
MSRTSKPSSQAASSRADSGFAWSAAQFQQLVDDALAYARQLGASDAAAEASEGVGLSVSVRKGELENVERNRDKSLGVTVYLGQRRGNAGTSDFSRKALEDTVRAAYDIARFTAEDPVAGLPDEKDLALDPKQRPELDLFHPWAVSAEQAAALSMRCEAAAFAVDKRITNSEGAGVSAQQSHFISGNSRGFRGGYASSRHSLSVAPIAGRGDGMQRDAWYSSMRDAQDLASPEAVGRYAAERALARLKSRRVPTGEYPVLFESTVAAGLLGAYVQATSGGALYRKASFRRHRRRAGRPASRPPCTRRPPCAGASPPASPSRWTPSSAAPKCLPTVKALSGGKFEISVHAGGELMPPSAWSTALQNGTLEMAQTAPYYFTGKDPIFAFGCAVPSA